MAYGFGGRAYDDDDCWWQEDPNTSSKPSDTNHTTHEHQHDNSSLSTPSQSNFHSLSHGGAYDDHTHNNTNSFHSTNHITTTQRTQPQTDCYSHQAKTNHSKPYNSSVYDQDNAHSQPKFPKAKTASNSFATKSVSSKRSNSSRSIHNSHNRKSAYSSQSSRSVYNTKRNAQKPKPRNTPQSISNPAYRNQIGNKYRNGRMPHKPRTNRAPRQRPEMQNMEEQQAYKQQLRSQTKAHLDESLKTTYQTEELAADTSEHLYYQRKQLENVDKMLHDTDQNLDRTEHTLKGMKSVWGGITNYFRKAPERQPYEKKKSAERVHTNNRMMEIEKERAQKGYNQSKKVELGGSKEEDEEFNEKLDDLHKSVKRLNVMAQNMNQEMDDQGELLDNIDDKMSNVDQRIHKQNYTINRIR